MNILNFFSKHLLWAGASFIVVIFLLFRFGLWSSDSPLIGDLIAAFDMVSIFLLLFTLAELRHQRAEAERLNMPITIMLKTEDGDTFSIPEAKLRRSQLTRAEVFGILRLARTPAAKKKQPEFTIASLREEAFFDRLQEVYHGRAKDFEILCTKQELKQFVSSKGETKNS